MSLKLQNLIKVEKPIVTRKGREVNSCDFFSVTGECFGSRCFWTRYGHCRIFRPEAWSCWKEFSPAPYLAVKSMDMIWDDKHKKESRSLFRKTERDRDYPWSGRGREEYQVGVELREEFFRLSKRQHTYVLLFPAAHFWKRNRWMWLLPRNSWELQKFLPRMPVLYWRKNSSNWKKIIRVWAKPFLILCKCKLTEKGCFIFYNRC